MEQDTTTAWPSMTMPAQEEDFSYLDFHDMQLNFPQVYDQGITGNGETLPPMNTQSDQMNMLESQIDMTVMTGNMLLDDNVDLNAGDSLLSNGHDMSQMPMSNGTQMQHHDVNANAQGAQKAAQFYQQQQQHDQYLEYQRHAVPPTPISMDVSAVQGQHYPIMDHTNAYRNIQRQQQALFTPLVSPAVTPIDTSLRMPEYAVPGEYFSPLTSPALQARDAQNNYKYYNPLPASDKSNSLSPIDGNQSPAPTSAPTVPGKKQKRKSVTNPLKAKQSPAMKAQKKRAASTMIPSKDVSDLLDSAKPASLTGSPRTLATKSSAASARDVSSESISPEPLDMLMPPPALPKSSSTSKLSSLRNQQPTSQPVPPVPPMPAKGFMTSSPATPASLMRIQNSTSPPQPQGLAIRDGSGSATPVAGVPLVPQNKPILPNLDTTVQKPSMEELQKSKSAGPTSGARTPFLQSIQPSPIVAALSKTPLLAAASPRPNTAMSNKSKKRTTVSQISPAIRPKLSPSIKPLLPEGTQISPETSALLLASRSNYQNILEGTHLPGVQYSEDLSTNLTSKRTSHKLAEQGRRNRINTALQEIASLLPNKTPRNKSSTSLASPEDDDEKPNGANGSKPSAAAINSKASTVEAAIEYIKELQRTNRELELRVVEAEAKLKNAGGSVSGSVSESSASGSAEENSNSSSNSNPTNPGEDVTMVVEGDGGDAPERQDLDGAQTQTETMVLS